MISKEASTEQRIKHVTRKVAQELIEEKNISLNHKKKMFTTRERRKEKSF